MSTAKQEHAAREARPKAAGKAGGCIAVADLPGQRQETARVPRKSHNGLFRTDFWLQRQGADVSVRER